MLSCPFSPRLRFREAHSMYGVLRIESLMACGFSRIPGHDIVALKKMSMIAVDDGGLQDGFLHSPERYVVGK